MKEKLSLGVCFEKDVAVPMRDGTVLRANILRPDDDGRYPALVERTPYGKAGPAPERERFVHAGYAVISQDTRGRYASDGEWIPFTVPNTGDAEDGYDTVEWVAEQPWCNGKAGTMGASYCAWTQWVLARLRPPHLVAMSARAIPPELTDVDWQGGFRPARRIHWWLCTMAPDLRRRHGLSPPHTPGEAKRIWRYERNGWLGLHPWSKIVRYLPPGLAEYAEEWLKSPGCRPWRIEEAYADIEVPNLDITGWYDHCNGSIRHHAGMQSESREGKAREGSRLIIGPWNHVGFGRREQGEIDFGVHAELDMTAVLIRWFDHWLKGIDNGVDRDPSVRYFEMGSGTWRSASEWPPPGTVEQEWFLGGAGGTDVEHFTGALSPEIATDISSRTYTYDPDNPVPTLWSERLFTQPADRRRLEYRQDILRYVSPPLEQDVDIAGEPDVILYAASSAPDTDFFASLSDDAPDGKAMEVSSGMVRARHRNGTDTEHLLEPGDVTEFRIKLGATACRFKKGHRIRLEITSSDFPNYDRNHNMGRNDLFDPEMTIAEQTVFHGGAYPSRLILPQGVR